VLERYKKYVKLGDQMKMEFPEAVVVTMPRDGYILFKYRQRRASGNIHQWDERVRNAKEWTEIKEDIHAQAEGVDDGEA
jgi:hypothetical protein